MNLIELIGSLMALVAAFVFAVIVPGSGLETVIIPLAGSIAGHFGLKNWRENYGIAKNWFESKTVIWSSIVAGAVILIVVLPLIFMLPEWINYILYGLVTVGGGGTLIGIFDAAEKNPYG